MEKSKETLEDAIDNFELFTSTFPGGKKTFDSPLVDRDVPVAESNSVTAGGRSVCQEISPPCPRSLKSEAVVNEIKRRIAHMQNVDKNEKEDGGKERIRRSQDKPNPYEDAVDMKITNQKMLRRLDNITEKLVNQVEPKAPKHLEVCDNLGCCTSCKLVILDIAVVAAGESFHQECFECHVCGNRLDTELFYQFEGKFFCEKDKKECLNRCQVCDDYITEGSVDAEGFSFHPACFTCKQCGLILTGEFYVGPAGNFICPEDYKNLKGSCCHCGKLLGESTLTALGKKYHTGCFRCSLCDTALSGLQFVCWQGAVNCKQCFAKYKAAVCAACKGGIIAEDNKKMTMVTCNGQTYHQECYACLNCSQNLIGKEAFEGLTGILCRTCKMVMKGC